MQSRTFISSRAQLRPFQEEDGASRERESGFVQGGHTSVMVREALEALSLRDGEVVVDATAGLGGHSEAMLSCANVRVVSLDADARAVEASRARLARFAERSTVLHTNFADMSTALERAGVTRVDKILFDLGWNKTQLQSGRGFSFLSDEPLHMGYSEQPRSGFTAAEILAQWDEETIANAIFGYGEERYARRIARAVVEARDVAPLETTMQLVDIIARAVPATYRRGRLHFATRTFQALRIAVNDELSVIETALTDAWNLLQCDGRIAVITFHSIEDRLVKRFFAAHNTRDGVLLYKKPLVPSKEEISINPSARSAKLRAIEKPCNDA